jgi:hypothetical protein
MFNVRYFISKMDHCGAEIGTNLPAVLPKLQCMKSPLEAFTQHPASVNETYVEHLGSAWSFGLQMIAGGLACWLHGLFPFLFGTTGSSTIRHLHERMVTHRTRQKNEAPAVST